MLCCWYLAAQRSLFYQHLLHSIDNGFIDIRANQAMQIKSHSKEIKIVLTFFTTVVVGEKCFVAGLEATLNKNINSAIN